MVNLGLTVFNTQCDKENKRLKMAGWKRWWAANNDINGGGQCRGEDGVL